MERLQKVMARAGVASRRRAEEMIARGEVTVNGRLVTEPGTKVDPERDHVKVNGKLLHLRPTALYLLFYKPKGVITSLSDPQGRPTISDFLRNVRGRVYPVGRLDWDTEGLLVLTNDGELAHRLMHPSFRIPKVYLAKVEGFLSDDEAKKIERGGLWIEGGESAPARVRRIKKGEKSSWVEVTLHEGKKRQVRRMLEHLGHRVEKLKRIGYAFLTAGGLEPGRYRHLTAPEVAGLKALIGLGGRKNPAEGGKEAARQGRRIAS